MNNGLWVGPVLALCKWLGRAQPKKKLKKKRDLPNQNFLGSTQKNKRKKEIYPTQLSWTWPN
jgi:hypothetical protein